MQVTCTYCRTLFALSREEILAALQQMERRQQKYFDAHCPKCRRANRVERKRFESALPQWRALLEQAERADADHQQEVGVTSAFSTTGDRR
ncbi:MAG: hypothetical protein N2049_09715 [Anaerolineales bacterium]|nr:hypothetical protein [Anaerolineales bacterium]MCX7609479.1 hypothetical protein [Anaerolineales bacterium]MDW8226239.1 hypothetical protein [Anaerolineales bacterium]